MNKIENRNKLAHPVFLVSIFTLLLNDFYLKYTFHNTLTGKLSDFAGLFAFPFFWSALFPKHSKGIHLFTALLFVLWKSTLLTPIITFINDSGLHTFRVLDLSDHLALISIPLSYFTFVKPAKNFLKPLLHKALFLLSIFSFVATTQYKEPQPYEDPFKWIEIYNQGNQKLTAVIDFRYTKAELRRDSNLNIQFNHLDTLSIAAGSTEKMITPIPKQDSTDFPKAFRVTILDSLGKNIKTYHKIDFLKAIDPDPNGSTIKMDAYYWHLTVGKKVPPPLQPWTMYGRWMTDTSTKISHGFEIREGYYYELKPNSEVLKYSIRDSTLTIYQKKTHLSGRILKLDSTHLKIKWQDKGTLKYSKIYK